MTRKPEAQFYVYRFDDEEGCVYIGKGSRSRFRAQQRKLARVAPFATGRIFDWFLTEQAALEAEKRYIAEHEPRFHIAQRKASGNLVDPILNLGGIIRLAIQDRTVVKLNHVIDGVERIGADNEP